MGKKVISAEKGKSFLKELPVFNDIVAMTSSALISAVCTTIIMDQNESGRDLVATFRELITKNAVYSFGTTERVVTSAKTLAGLFSKMGGIVISKFDDFYAACSVNIHGDGNFLTTTVKISVLNRDAEKLRSYIHANRNTDDHLPSITKVSNFCNSKVGSVREYYSRYELVMPPEQKDAIISRVSRFANNPKYYDDNFTSRKETIMLYGPPGTGKSILVKHLSSLFNLPIYTVGPDSESLNMLDRCGRATELHIVLFEDICRYVSTDVPEERRMDVGALLNWLNGVSDLHNCLVIITANNVDKLPKALTRPSRIDAKYLLDYVDLDLFLKFVKWNKDTHAEYIKVLADIIGLDKLTASIVGICAKADNVDSLKMALNESILVVNDEQF